MKYCDIFQYHSCPRKKHHQIYLDLKRMVFFFFFYLKVTEHPRAFPVFCI